MKEIFYFIEQDCKTGFVILFVCFAFTIMASLLDMWTALEVVRAGKKKPESRPLMKTGKKIIDYFRLILVVSMVDILGLLCFNFYAAPYVVVLITVGIISREALSMRENYALKKSVAFESVEIASKIVQCLKEDEAEKIIKYINERNFNKHNEK